MNKQQSLEMWYALWWHLRGVPNDFRSQNHTAFISEVRMNIYDLVNELGLSHKEFDTENESCIVPC